MIQPSKLTPGNTIGILCPAGAIPLEKVTICAQVLESWGYQVRIGKTVGTKFGHFAASDLDRQNELQSMMDDPEIHAILCARGGYGLSRIVSQLDFTKIKAHPKWVIGFSDITILHAALQKQGIQSIHGPMSAAFGKGDAGLPYILALKQMLEGAAAPVQAKAHPSNRLGYSEGVLVGGNLCLMTHLIGSKNQLDTKGKILCIEDVGEYHYNVDRMLIQCKNAGLLDGLAGFIVGGFTEMKAIQ
ncbi:MAG: LD-carboxypeptidase [Chitinophagia bacterium]|nr:LD-carboxypeptidase [Chitinophagia bacterium]